MQQHIIGVVGSPSVESSLRERSWRSIILNSIFENERPGSVGKATIGIEGVPVVFDNSMMRCSDVLLHDFQMLRKEIRAWRLVK